MQPIGRPVRPNWGSSSCRAPHLPFAPVSSSFLRLTFSCVAALLQYTFNVANHLPLSDCILPQSFFLGPEAVCLCCYILAIAVLTPYPHRNESCIYYRRLAATTKLRPYVVNIYTSDITPTTRYRQVDNILDELPPGYIIRISIALLHETKVLEPCRTHTTNTCTTMCGARHTWVLPAPRARQSTWLKGQVACS
jgi:hypothetical protein